MKVKTYSFDFNELNEDELNDSDKELLQFARKATERAYAPYSKFMVGASARLQDGTIVLGSNQENASFPAGLCAERVLISNIVTNYPHQSIHSIAISYQGQNVISNHPISPCGICRQVMVEHEMNSANPIRLILSGYSGKIWVLSSLQLLLPLGFSSSDLNQ